MDDEGLIYALIFYFYQLICRRYGEPILTNRLYYLLTCLMSTLVGMANAEI